MITREVLDGAGVSCVEYRTGREFLAADQNLQSGCVVLEPRLPDMHGVQIQHLLSASGDVLPVIFAVSKLDVSTAVEFMRSGAVHVLEKPVRPAELLATIQEALELSLERRRKKNEELRIKGLTATLSKKEVDVLELIATGRSPKMIATALQLSVRAVELRRKSLMSKLRVGSSLELMRFSVIAKAEFGQHRGFAVSVNCRL